MKDHIQIFSVSGCAVFMAIIASCTNSSDRKDQPWVEKLISSQRWGSHTVIEYVEYNGKKAIHVLPDNRLADGGSEHILYENRGQVIFKFGGLSGRVTR